MTVTLKVIFVAAVAGIVSGSVAAVVFAAFGWPLFLAAIAAGMGAGAAAARGYARIRAHAALRRGETPAASGQGGSNPAE